jgi:recombination DNA repair RAD52 pathway protein
VNGINPEQYGILTRPINGSRIAHRTQSGKQLSYLESWDVRAHLIRIFGYGNFDIETTDQYLVGVREYQSSGDTPKPMVEAIWFAKVRLTVRTPDGDRLCRFTESAVGGTSGPASMIGEHHDNAVKTAASDALKRCAINLGSQFGLSLYDNGSLKDVVKKTIVKPDGVEDEKPDLSPAQIETLKSSLGAEFVQEDPPIAPPVAPPTAPPVPPPTTPPIPPVPPAEEAGIR